MSLQDCAKDRSHSPDPKSDRTDNSSRSQSRSPRRRSRSRSSQRDDRSDRVAEQLARLHICNFDESLRKSDLEDAFSKYGKIDNVWLASYPPLFAFVTFKNRDEASDALKEMDNAYIGRNKIKVAKAHPPRRPGDRGPPHRFGGGRGGFYEGGNRFGRGGRSYTGGGYSGSGSRGGYNRRVSSSRSYGGSSRNYRTGGSNGNSGNRSLP
uniref:RRM domain-containing protein n=1 Tax=Syphacia muris TaxID=451379 RepID=A0A0N5AZR2_9BILA